MLRVLIIDDEQQAIQDLLGLLRFHNNIEVVGQAQNLKTAGQLIQNLKPQVVFLDIEVGRENSIQWLSSLSFIPFSIIFVTGHNAYAVEAFRFSAIDYLLKPVDPDQLDEAVSKLIPGSAIASSKLEVLQGNYEKKIPQRLILTDADNVYMVEVMDIIHCQASNNYTIFFMKNGKQLVISKSLKEYSELLESSGFFRIHKTHLINLKYFAKYHKQNGGMVVLADSTELPVAVRRKEALFDALQKLT